MKHFSSYWGFLKFLFQRFTYEIRILQVSGSLTYTTLLALIPLLTVMLVVVTQFPVFDSATHQFMAWVNEIIVPSGASIISEYLTEFKNAASKLTTLSVLIMVLTSISLVQTIDETFNRIFRVRQTRSLWVQYPIYFLLLMVAPVVVGLSSAVMSRLTQILSPFSGGWTLVWQILWDIMAIYVLFRVLPNRYVRKSHALIGAIFTAILFETCKWGFGIYVRNFNNYQLIYGAFAAIPVFLVWLQLLWVIVLTGALLTASLSYFKDSAHLRLPHQSSRLHDVIAILLQLELAKTRGRVLEVYDLRPLVCMDYDTLENVMLQLKQYGFVSSHRDGWLLRKPLNEISILELNSYFVYMPSHDNNAINTVLLDMMQPSLSQMDMSLADFKQNMLHYRSG